MYKRLLIIASSVVLVLVLGIIGIVAYTKLGTGFPCVFHEVTGKYCAGCGMTRAVISLSNLEFYQALRYNLFVFIALPFLAIYFLVESYYWLLNRKNRLDGFFHVVAVVIVVGLIAYGILRNIPKFSWLAPTSII